MSLDRPVQHPADVPVHALHQRLQPLRPDLPGAGGGAAAVPADAGGHRPALRARARRRDDSGLVRSCGTEFRSGPTQLLRFNGFGSAPTSPATPKPGRSSGEVMKEIDQLVAQQFEPQGVSVGYSGQSFQERAASGSGGHGLRAGSGHRLPGARGAVRELVDSVRGALRRAVRRARRTARRLAPRPAERHLLPGRADHGGGPRGQERHPDRGVRQRDASPRASTSARPRSRRRGSGSGRS